MGIGPWELAIILFILAGPVLLGVLFVAFLLVRGRSTKGNSSGSANPLQILQERYARGEIDTEEYEERRKRILSDQR
jgi:putative membrane protein